MPLTFRDRDGRKTTRFQVTADLTVHEVVNEVAWAVQAGLVNLSAITSDQALRHVVEQALLSAMRDGPQPIPADPAVTAEAMVVVAQHVGREQALELLRGPRPATEDRPTNSDEETE